MAEANRTEPSAAGRPIQDIREWLDRAEGINELIQIDKPVDRDEEMSAITYLVAKQNPSPAILFDNPKGYEDSPIGARMLWNILGPSSKRIALTIEEPPETPTLELIRRLKDKMKDRIPPREIPANEAPVYENTLEGADIDLEQLPIPRHWPLDGGRYAGTADAVFTRDPDSGYLNVGTYRMMLQGKQQVGLYLSPGKDARLHITRYWEKGESVPVAAAWGIDPLFMLVGSQTFPKNVSEYEFAGGIKGEAIPVVRARTSDLLLPANAELVVEGVIHPNSVKTEGPFGEFPGYYGRPEAGCPLVDITRVHYRSNPVLTNAIMADYPSCEQSGFFAVIRSARIWDDLDKLGIPGVQGVYAHPAGAGGFGMTVISVEQRYAGHSGPVPGAGRPGARRGLLHQVDHRRGRGHRSHRHGPGDLGHEQPLQSHRGHRRAAEHLEHLAGSHAEPAGRAAVRFQGVDQRLQGAPLPAGVLQAHHAEAGDVRPGGRALEGVGAARNDSIGARLRGGQEGRLPRAGRLRARQEVAGAGFFRNP